MYYYISLGARRQKLVFAVALTIVAVHSLVPHKEYRFIYPAVLLLMLLTAACLAELTLWATQWATHRGLQPP